MSKVPHQPAFCSFPLALCAAGFAVGIHVATTFTPGSTKCFVFVAAALAIALCASARHHDRLASIVVLLAFFFAGMLSSSVETNRVADTRLKRMFDRREIASGENAEMTGVLERAPEIAPDGLYITLSLTSLLHRTGETFVTGRVELFAPTQTPLAQHRYEQMNLRRGARIRAMTALVRADRYRNPGITPLTQILDQRDLDAIATIKSPLLVERLGNDGVFYPLVALEQLRAGILTFFDRTFSAETSGVLKASLLGNRYGLSKESGERFREGGTFHVLVISGMHISFIAGLVWLMARRLTPRSDYQWMSAVIVAWLYTIFAGSEPSVVRAALMFTIMGFASVVGRRATPINTLGAAALVLLVWRPANLYDPSFQLTFLSVFAISAIAMPLLKDLKAVGDWRPANSKPYPPRRNRWWRTLGEILFWSEREWNGSLDRTSHSYMLFKSPLARRLDRWRLQRVLRYVFVVIVVSIVVQLTLLPLLVLYFHRLSLVGPFLNVFVGVCMVVLSLTAIMALFVSQLGMAAPTALLWIAEQSSWLMAHVVDPFESRGIASVRLPEYTGMGTAIYFIYFVPVVVLAVALNRPKSSVLAWESNSSGLNLSPRLLRPTCFLFLASLSLIVFHPFSSYRSDTRLHVDFLDVGQGDSALITMPNGQTVLLDAGGRRQFGSSENGFAGFEKDGRAIGEAVVSEYLWWKGLDHIDYVVPTHGDVDHIEGFNDVVRNFDVEAALVARAPANNQECTRFARTAARKDTPMFSIGRGDRLRFGDVNVDILWPRYHEATVAWENNDSVVIRVTFGKRTFIFTGDIEKRAESWLVSSESLRCDAVKVAHHGSRTSSTELFVQASQAFAGNYFRGARFAVRSSARGSGVAMEGRRSASNDHG